MRSPLLFLVGFGLVACGPDDRNNMGTPDATGSDAPVTKMDAPPVVDTSRVFAHSGQRLYQLNTTTLAAEEIGAFANTGTQSITDIAIDKNDRMLGITMDKLYEINPTTGAATMLANLDASADGFTSLSFIPVAGNDILVSANDQGGVFRIDITAGSASMIGSYGMVGPDQIRSSGDLIGVQGLGIYATVDRGDIPGDYLAKIDETTWQATLAPNPTGFDKIFGLGFWAGKFYGFVDDGFDAGSGKIIEIDPDTGIGTVVLQENIRWFGAGVATDAPILQ